MLASPAVENNSEHISNIPFMKDGQYQMFIIWT